MDIELRKFYNDIISIVGTAKVPIEAKRITLELVAKQCELQANESISTQLQTITEKGELDNGAELD